MYEYVCECTHDDCKEIIEHDEYLRLSKYGAFVVVKEHLPRSKKRFVILEETDKYAVYDWAKK